MIYFIFSICLLCSNYDLLHLKYEHKNLLNTQFSQFFVCYNFGIWFAIFCRQKKNQFRFWSSCTDFTIGFSLYVSSANWLQLAHVYIGIVRMHTEYDTVYVFFSALGSTLRLAIILGYDYSGVLACLRVCVCVYLCFTGLHQVRFKAEGFFPLLVKWTVWLLFWRCVYAFAQQPKYNCIVRLCVCTCLSDVSNKYRLCMLSSTRLADICFMSEHVRVRASVYVLACVCEC